MANEMMSNWSQTSGGMFSSLKTPNLKNGKRLPKSKGNIIMEVAEILRPYLMQMLDGVRDNKGMLVQPATVRAIALNVAQDIVNDPETKMA